MKDSEDILKIKSEISNLNEDLKESLAQLGGVFYDSGETPGDPSLVEKISDLEDRIPEIKERMDGLKRYTLSIKEAEDEIRSCRERLKEIEHGLSPLYEKIGVELYCFMGDKELSYPEIEKLYTEIKEGESKSEGLENRLYSYENSVAKNGVLNLFSKPFKVRGIRKEIRHNNKLSLKKFRELGKLYSETPKLIDSETNESLLDILEEFKKIKSDIKGQHSRIELLKKRIEENREKVDSESNGLRLKTLYSKLEDEIIDTQRSVTDRLVELGLYIAESDLEYEGAIKTKKDNYLAKQKEIVDKEKELLYLEKEQENRVLLNEIKEREESFRIEEEHIASLNKRLEEHRQELERVIGESEALEIWLKENSLSGE